MTDYCVAYVKGERLDQSGRRIPARECQNIATINGCWCARCYAKLTKEERKE